MDRKEFLSLLGLSVGGTVVVSCLGGCAKEDGPNPGGGGNNNKVDFTLDLTEAGNAALNNNGGFVVKNGVIIGRTTSGTYIAVAAACTHQGTIVQYQANNQRFFCPNHGSNFSETGAVLNGPATGALQQYKTELSGSKLRIFA
jgi:cytochrome b6-f complex iron-sulfur subunit